MPSSEFSNYFAGLRAELAKLPQREPKGALLARARAIELAWPPEEFPADRSLVDQFERALMPWGGKVQRLASEAEVPEKLQALITEAQARRLSRWRTDRLDRIAWDTLTGADLEWIQPAPKASPREVSNLLESIDLGIIDCDFAVAHTGSLVLCHEPNRNGYTNLLPWNLVAVVWENQLLRTLQDAIDALKNKYGGGPWPNHVVFVTGPSRSGDIDLHAGQGAAGPGRHHVLMITSQ